MADQLAGQPGNETPEAAVERLSIAVAANGASAELHAALANALNGLGRLDEAVRCYDQAIDLDPNNASLHNGCGNALQMGGRLEEALVRYTNALALNPDYVGAHYNRANTLLRLERRDEAVAGYDAAITLKPDLADAYNNRGVALAGLERDAESVASCDRAIALRPDYVDAHVNRAIALRKLGRPMEAVAGFDVAASLDPGRAGVHYNRGLALYELSELEEALASYDRAIALQPDHAEAHNNRALALHELNRFDEALASYDTAIAVKPDFAAAYSGRGVTLYELGRADDALASYDRAIGLQPDYAEAYDNKSVLLTELGRFSEANDAVEQAIALAPTRVRSYYHLAQSKRLALGDPHVRAMQALERDLPSLAFDDQIELQFALAKVFAENGDPAASFQRLLPANAMKRSKTAYDETADLGLFERIRAVFTPGLISAHAGCGDPSDRPVFVLGMPRSGTTLAEQILASHPKVFAAGETERFPRTITALEADETAGWRFPEAVPRMSARELRRLGQSYLAGLDASASLAQRVTDKTLHNFLCAGLIHLALPNARIIHARRDPLDTCLSCFSKLFEGNLPYTYDLGELGRYYRAYEAIMAHWRALLPEDVMIDVQYEDVIADLEGQARRIIAHCGLDWDPRCLEFHLTERAVRTSSAIQVRQPIYDGSVGRWRMYEPFLKPLLDELHPSTAASRY